MITIFCWSGYTVPANQLYPLIKSVGFDGVSLWWDEKDDPDYRHNPETTRKAGLWIENIHAPFEKSNDIWLDNLDGEETTKMFLKCIDDCAEYDIPTMVMHASCGEALPINEIGMQRFELLIERAEQKNVNIALENMRRTSQLAHTAKILETFVTPRLGLCFDSGHHNARMERSPEYDLLSRFGNRLMALHLHDNEGVIYSDNKDDQHRLPFDGTIDWSTTMKTITNTGYTGATSLEAMNWSYKNLSVEEFLIEAVNRAKKLEMLK